MSVATPSQSIANTLAGQYELGRGVAFVVFAILGSIVLTAAAKIQVPFWPVPMTLQTLALFAIAAMFGARLAVATVLLYFAEGFAGLPVFAGPIAGPAYFTGPTAGFLLGFIAVAAIVGHAADRGWSKSPQKMFGAMLLGDAVLFTLGFVWLAFMFVSAKTGATLGASTAFAAGVQPFILADLLKIAIAAIGVPMVWKLVRHR